MRFKSKTKVWLYCRTACLDSQEMQDQIDALKRYARNQNMTVAGITAEQSGILDMHRPGLDEVRRAAEHGKMRFVLVQDISRLGQRVLDTRDYVDHLRAYGVHVICADSAATSTHRRSFLDWLASMLPQVNRVPS